MTNKYCISKSHTYYIASSLLQHVLKMSFSSTNASGKCSHHSISRLVNLHFTR